ncbi:aminopeptidase PepB [Salinivibrio sp. IB574]|uniref:aminopeptidase PepB n=1 Tax=Salinivibrio sp. IB574 TaxID=1909444 RepID=UPI000989393A|nr:aminopeptidase PepB [Salinivibrio sp. IB574]OOF23888.1 aminopeptidase PepB [Salinivibrio sp. IB574]
MSETLMVTLSHEPAAAHWGENALVSFEADKAVVHAPKGETQRDKVQQAARKLEGQGVPALTLGGDQWDLELAWAFYQGLRGPKNTVAFEQAVLSGADADEFALRQRVGDWVRDIINQTAEEVGPHQLAARAGEFVKSMAPEAVSYKIISGTDLLEQGWNGIYTVGRGSARKPTMLQLDFNPTGDESAPVYACLVGKGITFDSGGYSIKPSDFMASMKADMGGAATATGALAMAIAKGLNKRVKLILCCAENMISSSAYKLGDIITYKNGVTVEVLNTDAEGRLVLADGLMYASEHKPELLIDCATLTGAAKAALGNDYHALFSFDDSLAHRTLEAAQQEGEGMWPLPLAEFHRKLLPSSFADIANASSGAYMPGASTAAAFLSYFVDDYQKGWMHVDCSGTYRKAANDKWAVGATGMGVKTLARVLLDEAK